jgi:hypothetical protein
MCESVILVKPEKYDEVIRGYGKAIKIDAKNAEAYHNKDVILCSWAQS